MTSFRRVLFGLFIFASSVVLFAAADVVVLKGGTRIELQKPAVRQGGVALLTRADGTLLSVPLSEIDWKATAAVRAERSAAKPAATAVAAPPETPAQAAKASREGPRARVKLTDADVQHPLEPEETGEEKAGGAADAGSARLEVSDYTQEKSGANLIVRGDLRNPGSAPASSARMSVTAIDEKGEKIASTEAGLSNALVSPGASVSFSATIPVGDRTVTSLRFAPQWLAPPAPAPAPAPAPTASAAAAPPKPASTPPGPTPTPYGQSSLYAPPPAAAPTAPPADGNRGYIPGMSEPSSQPKPPK